MNRRNRDKAKRKKREAKKGMTGGFVRIGQEKRDDGGQHRQRETITYDGGREKKMGCDVVQGGIDMRGAA